MQKTVVFYVCDNVSPTEGICSWKSTTGVGKVATALSACLSQGCMLHFTSGKQTVLVDLVSVKTVLKCKQLFSEEEAACF
jgi:hypothetical protein